MATIKVQCTCDHPSQDKLHGKKVRIYNEALSKSGKGKKFRCTVCGKEVDRG